MQSVSTPFEHNYDEVVRKPQADVLCRVKGVTSEKVVVIVRTQVDGVGNDARGRCKKEPYSTLTVHAKWNCLPDGVVVAGDAVPGWPQHGLRK